MPALAERLNRVSVSASVIMTIKARELAAQGIKVITPDVAAFRKAVQEKYLASDMAKNWEKGLLQRIIDVK